MLVFLSNIELLHREIEMKRWYLGSIVVTTLLIFYWETKKGIENFFCGLFFVFFLTMYYKVMTWTWVCLGIHIYDPHHSGVCGWVTSRFPKSQHSHLTFQSSCREISNGYVIFKHFKLKDGRDTIHFGKEKWELLSSVMKNRRCFSCYECFLPLLV